MKKQIEITVPNDYSAVTLKQYLKLQEDLKNYEDDVEAQDAFLIYNLTGMTPDMLVELDEKTISGIRTDLTKMLSKQDYTITRLLKIDDVEYGFEPNLSEMPYGAYLDISKFDTISIDDNWAYIMSVLYRPVKKKRGALYEIEKYNGVEPWDEEKWLNVGMDVHFGCFFFFTRLYKELVSATLNSLKNQTGISPNISTILERSGETIQQLSTLQEKIS